MPTLELKKARESYNLYILLCTEGVKGIKHHPKWFVLTLKHVVDDMVSKLGIIS